MANMKQVFRLEKIPGRLRNGRHGYLKFDILTLISINYNAKDFIMRREEISKLMSELSKLNISPANILNLSSSVDAVIWKLINIKVFRSFE